MAEGVLCQSAFNTIRDDNEALSSQLFLDKSSGITFNQLKCDLCKRNVNVSTAETGESSLDLFDEQDPLNEQLMLFQCKRTQVNHCFHQRCLYLHDEAEL